MEFNQVTESFHNQITESYSNQHPIEPLYNSRPPSTLGAGQPSTEPIYGSHLSSESPYHNPSEPLPSSAPLTKAAESFCLGELRKLETEKALWKKDQQILNKEISRLNERVTVELERRTDYEFEKASLQEELDACYVENECLQRQLRKKCEEADKLRLRCADLENKLNHLQQAKVVVAKKGTCQFYEGRKLNHSTKSASWAERSRLEVEEMEFRGGGRRRRKFDADPVLFSSARASAMTPSSDTSSSDDDEDDDDDDDRHGLWMKDDYDEKKKKHKSSTLTRKKETLVKASPRGVNTTATAKNKTTNSLSSMNQMDQDLSTLRQNIHIVNKKMAKNDKEIQKLENCVQTLAMNRD